MKLPAMTAPNGLAGIWFSVGLIDSAMNPSGFMNEPMLIERTTMGGGTTRR